MQRHVISDDPVPHPSSFLTPLRHFTISSSILSRSRQIFPILSFSVKISIAQTERFAIIVDCLTTSPFYLLTVIVFNFVMG
jgi:hypothetical protein